MTPDVAARIRAEHAAIGQAVRGALEHAKTAGDLLITVRDSSPHGKWLPWVATNLPDISIKTVQNYIRVAEHWNALTEGANAQRVSHLPLRSALALLAKPKTRKPVLLESAPHAGRWNHETPHERPVTAMRDALSGLSLSLAWCDVNKLDPAFAKEQTEAIRPALREIAAFVRRLAERGEGSEAGRAPQAGRGASPREAILECLADGEPRTVAQLTHLIGDRWPPEAAVRHFGAIRRARDRHRERVGKPELQDNYSLSAKITLGRSDLIRQTLIKLGFRSIGGYYQRVPITVIAHQGTGARAALAASAL